ncbi:hypothetical protein [Nocardia salmonicida]|uniref:hypothetical protein n=1 Tax=Nocardia salmonicida TaxID=53431 RepID=UPI0033C6785A
MTIQMTPTEITSDRSAITAKSLGNGRFDIAQLRGRILSRTEALGLVQLADALGDLAEPYPPDHPIWIEVAEWVLPSKLTILEAVGHLGLSSLLPLEPPWLSADFAFPRPRPSLVESLRGGWWR